MSTRVVSSSLWIVAGVLGISTSLVFRVEPLPWAITIALGILAVLVGTVLSCERPRGWRGGRWHLGSPGCPAMSPSPCGSLVIRRR